MKSKVFFSKEITPEKVVEMYHALGIELPGKVATKLHSILRLSLGSPQGIQTSLHLVT